MEPKNHKFFPNFLTSQKRSEIIDFVNTIDEEVVLKDHHLKHLVGKLNGHSYMYNIGQTEITDKITSFQSGGTVMRGELPPLILRLVEEISGLIGIPKTHSFLQIVDMTSEGTVGRHYDASFPGHINYKCNISVLAEDYEFSIDTQTLNIKAGDMYCFEASLYKHWTPQPFSARRVLLSFGFMVPYVDLGRTPNDPRVRLSERIAKYFQK